MQSLLHELFHELKVIKGKKGLQGIKEEIWLKGSVHHNKMINFDHWAISNQVWVFLDFFDMVVIDPKGVIFMLCITLSIVRSHISFLIEVCVAYTTLQALLLVT